MKPKPLLPNRRPICQLCERVIGSRGTQLRPLSVQAASPWTKSLSQTVRPRPIRNTSKRTYSKAASKARKDNVAEPPAIGGGASNEVNIANKLGKAILASKGVPPEKEVLEALYACGIAAGRLMGSRDIEASESKDGSPTSALLSLEHRSPPISSPGAMLGVELISSLAHSILKHPTVFISPEILEVYIDLQSILHRPSTFPEILHLYATKPVPKPDSNPPIYTTPNPNKAAAAIPTAIAYKALDAAIQNKDLLTCLNVIETSFRTKAFHRAKLIRRALVPGSLLACTPGLAYTVANQFALHQNTMSHSMATGIAMTGIMTYVSIVTTLGYISITTANDHHDRVSWVPGMPLRERWLREEERAAADRIAQAWGFKEQWKRGEEEGWEWEELRDWIALRGMELDRVSLMEGME